MRESEWSGARLYPRPKGWPFAPEDEPDTCPGYLVSLPTVLEAARCWSWGERGQLSVPLEGREPTGVLTLLIEALAGEDGALGQYVARGEK